MLKEKKKVVKNHMSLYNLVDIPNGNDFASAPQKV